MEEIIRNIEKDVNLILKNDKSGHGIEHINRVLNESLFLANFYDANKDLVSIIALLHDVDDYKIVGLDKANSYDNARIIMNKYNLDKEIIDFVIEAISKIGYSKRLGGISPNSIEAMIVSDADMLDSIGAIGLIRTIEYNVSKDRKIFDKDIFPNINLTKEEYQAKDNGTVINHFFEKLLKIKEMLILDKSKEIAKERHSFMVSFLKEFFKETNNLNWINYLDKFIERE